MAQPAVPNWRAALQAALPQIDASRAELLANLNETTPWRTFAADIRLDDGRRVVLKFPYDDDGGRERAAASFIDAFAAEEFGPRLYGIDAASGALACEYVDGVELHQALSGPGAASLLIDASRLIARLHDWATPLTERWLALFPADRQPEFYPGYDQPLEQMAAPFRAVATAGQVESVLAEVRRCLAEPGAWLGFVHGDLQTRHFRCTSTGIRLVDWECAGLRHQLLDLASIIQRVVWHGGRLPPSAESAVVDAYAQARGVPVAQIRHDLAPVLAYEWVTALSEEWGERTLAVRAAVVGLLALSQIDVRLAELVAPLGRLLVQLPPDEIPYFAGLA